MVIDTAVLIRLTHCNLSIEINENAYVRFDYYLDRRECVDEKTFLMTFYTVRVIMILVVEDVLNIPGTWASDGGRCNTTAGRQRILSYVYRFVVTWTANSKLSHSFTG